MAEATFKDIPELFEVGILSKRLISVLVLPSTASLANAMHMPSILCAEAKSIGRAWGISDCTYGGAMFVFFPHA